MELLISLEFRLIKVILHSFNFLYIQKLFHVEYFQFQCSTFVQCMTLSAKCQRSAVKEVND